jgi:hypothetical protein
MNYFMYIEEILNNYKSIWGRLMVLNATFHNMSVISGRSVVLVQETGVHVETH